MVIVIICDYFIVIDDYLWLWYVSQVRRNEGLGELFFAKKKKTINEW